MFLLSDATFRCTNLAYLYNDGRQGRGFWGICDDSIPLLPLQIYSARDLEDNLNKIREICSDDKHDWDQRANAVSRSTLNALNLSVSLFLILDCCHAPPPYNRPPQMKKIRSLLVAGATTYDCFYQHLRLLDGAFKLSAKDLRSQVVREACITVAWVIACHLGVQINNSKMTRSRKNKHQNSCHHDFCFFFFFVVTYRQC